MHSNGVPYSVWVDMEYVKVGACIGYPSLLYGYDDMTNIEQLSNEMKAMNPQSNEC